MSISSIGALASSIGFGGSPQNLVPAFAVSYRFTVDVDGAELGDWQSCSGVKVDYKPVELHSGGRYLGSHYLAGEATYSKVVLKRAVAADTAAKTGGWLDNGAVAWLSGSPSPAGHVTITVHSSQGDQLMWIKLNAARPAGWSVSDLDATSSKLVVETLELVHEGFTYGYGKGQPVATDSTPPKPLILQASGQKVSFAYAPTTIGLGIQQLPGAGRCGTSSKATGGDIVAITTPGGDLPPSPNVTTYTLSELTLDGASVPTQVQRLTEWSTAKKVPTGGKPVLADVDFTWGSGFNAKVQIKQLTVSYTRFTPEGVPCRAKVTLRLEKIPATGPTPGPGGAPPPVTPTAGNVGGSLPALGDHHGASNPTSGGIPGRSTQLMVQSDSLAAMAQRTYGHGQRWRDIAEANGVDDPLRVPAGTTLFLPALSELPGLAPGAGAGPGDIESGATP